MRNPPFNETHASVERTAKRTPAPAPRTRPSWPRRLPPWLRELGQLLLKGAALGAACGVLVGLVIAAVYFFWVPQYVEGKVRAKLAAVSEGLGQDLSFSHLEMDGARAILHNVALARAAHTARVDVSPVLTIPRVFIDVDLRSLFDERPRVREVVFMAPHLELVRARDGHSDLDPLLTWAEARLVGDDAEDPSSDDGPRLGDRFLPDVRIEGGSVRVRDAMHPARLDKASTRIGELLNAGHSPIEFARDVNMTIALPAGRPGVGARMSGSALLEPTREPLPVTVPRKVKFVAERVGGREGWRLQADMEPEVIVSRLPQLPRLRVSLKGVELNGTGQIALHGVEVARRDTGQRVISVARADIGINARSPREIQEVKLHRPTLRLETHADGTHNLGALLASPQEIRSELSGGRQGTSTPQKRRRADAARRATRSDQDDKRKRRRKARRWRRDKEDYLVAGRMAASAEQKIQKAIARLAVLGPKLTSKLPGVITIEEGRLDWRHDEQIWRAEGVDGDVTHDERGQKVTVSLNITDARGVAGAVGGHWRYADPNADDPCGGKPGEGEPITPEDCLRHLDLNAALRFEQIDVAALVRHVRWDHRDVLHAGRLSGELDVHRRAQDGQLSVKGALESHGLTLAHPKLARDPLKDINARVEGELLWEPQEGDLTISKAQLSLGKKARARFEIGLESIGDSDMRAALDMQRIKVHVVVPDTPAQDLLEAFPLALRQEIDGMKMVGTFGWDFRAVIDPVNISHMQVVNDIRLKDFDIVDYNARTDVRKLNTSFRHAVTQPETGHRFTIRADGPSWVPLRKVSAFAIKALRTNEDGSFYSHRGFSWMQIRATLEQNVRARRVVRGASTVSMQLVKNVFLSHERTLARKLQEALLTFAMEQVARIPKDRILETYMNIVEWGPGVYGIRRAARHYFNRPPWGLRLDEAVFLISILPGPRKFHRYKERGWISDHWWERMQRLMGVMLERNHINQEQYDEAIAERPYFRRARVERLDDSSSMGESEGELELAPEDIGAE